ncbi:MAG: phage/plasmid primase, P4 family [Candidatus Brocadia sinica]|nr:phage/plasmid primase, P4 family [Candidatus Brocadia sinica]
MNKTEILNRLDKSKFYQELIPSLEVNGKPEALGLCPFHDDTNPSLSVNVESGLFRCFSCDAKGDIFTFYQRFKDVDFPTALREIGKIAGIVESDIKPKVVATFKYMDEASNVLYLKERLEPGRNGKRKEFVFKHLEGDRWAMGRGCDPAPYNLPQITKSKYCFIVEGEAKADLLNSWGLVATCLDSGANSPIKNEHIEILSKLEKVVILPDSDKPGREYASKIASVLHGKVGELRVVELPGLSEAEDVLDWSKIPGNNKEKLIELVQNAPEWMPDKGKAASVNQPEINKSKVFNCTDLGNAKRLVSQHGAKIRYCFAWKKWLVWDGKAWGIDNNGQILRLAKKTVHNIYQEAYLASDPDISERLGKWGAKSQGKDKITAMVSLAESEEGIPISPNELDTNPYLLNCLNGTIDLKTGDLKPHDPKDFITKIIRVEYDPAAQYPQWLEFLEMIFNWNYDLIRFIQRAVGYSLTGDTSEQCLFLPYGLGENGKSSFIDAISTLLGDYAQTADFETFLIKKNDGGTRNDIARMKGRRFISAVETEGDRRLAEVLVKQLTGGDTITARFLYGEFFDFKPEFKLWLACNHKPNIKGTDHAIWRRIKLIPFNVKIPKEKRILKSKVMEMFTKEFPGILAWAVQGSLEWRRGGLQTPEEVQNATNHYREEMDVIGVFLAECCILTPEVKSKASDLYGAYKNWCEAGGEYILSQRSFGLRLTERGLERVKSSGNYWRGIGIKIEK